MNIRRFRVVALTLALVAALSAFSATAFAASDYYNKLGATNASVTLDGTNDGEVTVSLVGTADMDVYAIQGDWDTKETEGTNKLKLDKITTDVSNVVFTGMNYADAPTGKVLWTDDTFSAPAKVANGTKLLNATYKVAADTPAGTYTVRFKFITLTATDYNSYTDEVYYTAQITVTRPAAHTCSGTFTKGQAATCTVDGWNDYYKCSDTSCGKLYSDAACTDEITDLAAWKAGAGKIAASHAYGTLVPEVPATHKADELKAGMKAHYFCDKCDTYFTAEKVATTESNLVIPAPAHSFDKQEATEDYLASEATCEAKATYYKSCSCGAEGTETFESGDYADHAYGTLVAKVPATHKADELKAGMKAHYVCGECGKYFTEGKVETTAADLVIPAPVHEYDTANGYKQADGHADTCSCGAHDTVAGHTPNIPAPTETEDQVCSVCGYVIAPKLDHIHVYDKQEATEDYLASEATCEAKATYYKSCSCGAEGTETFESGDYADHAYGTLVAKVPATHKADELKAGMKAHYVCGECGKYFTEGKVETTAADLVIPAPVHEYDTANGYKQADGHADTCSCGAHDTVAGHTPNIPAPTETEDQVCSVCGYVIASAVVPAPITVEIPVTKTVSKGGAADFSGSEKFEFVVEPLNTNISAGRLTIEGNSVIVTNMNGGSTVIKVTVPASLYNEIEGFKITEKAGSAEGWSYSADSYRVLVSPNGDRYLLEGEEANTSVESIVFTNTYTKEKAQEPANPGDGNEGEESKKPESNDSDKSDKKDVIAKTGDETPFAGLFVAAAAAGIAVLALRRRIA